MGAVDLCHSKVFGYSEIAPKGLQAGERGYFAVMHGSILPAVTIHPPGHTPGDLQFFSHLVIYSPPPGTPKETIPHTRDSSSAANTLFIDHNIDFRTIAKPDVLTRT